MCITFRLHWNSNHIYIELGISKQNIQSDLFRHIKFLSKLSSIEIVKSNKILAVPIWWKKIALNWMCVVKWTSTWNLLKLIAICIQLCQMVELSVCNEILSGEKNTVSRKRILLLFWKIKRMLCAVKWKKSWNVVNVFLRCGIIHEFVETNFWIKNNMFCINYIKFR